MKLRLLFCLPLLSMLLSPAALAQMKLEVIPLKGRTAEEMIPVIRPLLVPGGSVTGMDNNLIVKTTPENLEDIRNVLANLDRPPRLLRITVAQNADAESTGRDQGVSGRYRSGNVDARIGDRRPREGLEVGVGEGDDEIRYRLNENQGRTSDHNSYFVQTMEGRAAFIETGSSIPIRHRSIGGTPRGGVVVQDTVEYHNATSGFYVLPRLSGDTVTLHISPFMSNVVPGRVPAFSIQNAETTVSAPLGQWMEIGGIDTSRRREDRELLSTRDRYSAEQRSIRIRVDEVE